MADLEKVSRFQLELDAAKDLVQEFRNYGDHVNAGKACLLVDFVKEMMRLDQKEP